MFDTQRVQLIYFTDKTATTQYYTRTVFITDKLLERFLYHNDVNMHKYIRYLLKDIPGHIKRKEWEDKKAVFWGIPVNASIVIAYYPLDFRNIKYLRARVFVSDDPIAVVEDIICL